MVRLRCLAWLVLSLALKLAFIESQDSYFNVEVYIDVGTPYRRGSERFVDYTCNLLRATNVTCTRKIQGSQAGYLGYLGCCFKQREDNSTTVSKIECNTEPESRDCTDSSYILYKELVPLTPRKDSSKIAYSTETTLKTSPTITTAPEYQVPDTPDTLSIGSDPDYYHPYSDTSSSSEEGSFSSGAGPAIIGGTVGGLVFLIICALIVKRKLRRDHQPTTSTVTVSPLPYNRF